MTDSGIPSLDAARIMIDLYGKNVANLRDQNNLEIELLKLRDTIQDVLDHYLAKGAYLDPELTRLGNHDGVFQGKAFAFVRMAGYKKLAENRALFSPVPERWWWFLDQKVQQEKRRRLKKNIKNLSIVVGVLLVVYFVFLRLPPDEQLYHETLASIERLADDYTRAATPSQQDEYLREIYRMSFSIKDLFPERPSPILIAGLAGNLMGETEEGFLLLQQAERLYQSEEEYLMEKAGWYIRFGLLDTAFSHVSRILEMDRDHLGAWNLQGMIYEMQEKLPDALYAYDRVLELAEEQGVINLIPVIRMKVAMLQLRLPVIVP